MSEKILKSIKEMYLPAITRQALIEFIEQFSHLLDFYHVNQQVKSSQVSLFFRYNDYEFSFSFVNQGINRLALSHNTQLFYILFRHGNYEGTFISLSLHTKLSAKIKELTVSGASYELALITAFLNFFTEIIAELNSHDTAKKNLEEREKTLQKIKCGQVDLFRQTLTIDLRTLTVEQLMEIDNIARKKK